MKFISNINLLYLVVVGKAQMELKYGGDPHHVAKFSVSEEIREGLKKQKKL